MRPVFSLIFFCFLNYFAVFCFLCCAFLRFSVIFAALYVIFFCTLRFLWFTLLFFVMYLQFTLRFLWFTLHFLVIFVIYAVLFVFFCDCVCRLNFKQITRNCSINHKLGSVSAKLPNSPSAPRGQVCKVRMRVWQANWLMVGAVPICGDRPTQR